MEILKGVLVVLHLLGWAIVLGGVVTRLSKPSIAIGVLHGALTALVTGVLLVGLIEMDGGDVNTVKIVVKLLVALAVVVLIWRGQRRESVTTGYLGAIAGLTALNVAIAVLWR